MKTFIQILLATLLSNLWILFRMSGKITKSTKGGKGGKVRKLILKVEIRKILTKTV